MMLRVSLLPVVLAAAVSSGPAPSPSPAQKAMDSESALDLRAQHLTLTGRFISRRRLDTSSMFSADIIEASWALVFEATSAPGRPIEFIGYSEDCPSKPFGDAVYRITLEKRRFLLALRTGQSMKDFKSLASFVLTSCAKVDSALSTSNAIGG